MTVIKTGFTIGNTIKLVLFSLLTLTCIGVAILGIYAITLSFAINTELNNNPGSAFKIVDKPAPELDSNGNMIMKYERTIVDTTINNKGKIADLLVSGIIGAGIGGFSSLLLIYYTLDYYQELKRGYKEEF